MTGMKHNILPLADLKKLSQVFANYKSDQVDRKEVEKCDAKGGNEEQIRNEKLEKDSKQDRDTQGIFGGKDSRVHAFLVGQACHWISIVSFSQILLLHYYFYSIFKFIFGFGFDIK